MAVKKFYFCCSDLTTDSLSPHSSTRNYLLQTAFVFSEKLYFNLFSELPSSQHQLTTGSKGKQCELALTETRVISCCVASFKVLRRS